MGLETAKARGESHVLIGGEGLVAPEDHLVVMQRFANFGDDFVAEWPGEIEALDLAADGGAELSDLKVLVLQCCQPTTFGGQIGAGAIHHGGVGQHATRLRYGRNLLLGWLNDDRVGGGHGFSSASRLPDRPWSS